MVMDSTSCRELISILNGAIANEKPLFESSPCASALHDALLKLRSSYSRNEDARCKLVELNIVPKLFSLLKKPKRHISHEQGPGVEAEEDNELDQPLEDGTTSSAVMKDETGTKTSSAQNSKGDLYDGVEIQRNNKDNNKSQLKQNDGGGVEKKKLPRIFNRSCGGFDSTRQQQKQEQPPSKLDCGPPPKGGCLLSDKPSDSTSNTTRKVLSAPSSPIPTPPVAPAAPLPPSQSSSSLSTMMTKSADANDDDGGGGGGGGMAVDATKCRYDVTDLLLSVLANFCVEQAARKQVIKCQGIRVLRCILMESGRESIQRRCCRTLANLAVDCSCRGMIHKLDLTLRIVQLLEVTNDSESQLVYCHTLRLFGSSTQLHKTIINCNGIAVLSRLSKFAPYHVKYSAVKTMATLGRISCCVEFAQQVLTADGLSTLVEISNEGDSLSENALRILIYLSRHNFIRPPLGSSGGIQTLKNRFDTETSTARKVEILNALCLFCNEAVNRVKLRQSDVLVLFIGALNDAAYSALHNRVISALVNFLYDEVSFDLLLERGLVPVLFVHLQRCAGFSFNLPTETGEPFVKALVEDLAQRPEKQYAAATGSGSGTVTHRCTSSSDSSGDEGRGGSGGRDRRGVGRGRGAFSPPASSSTSPSSSSSLFRHDNNKSTKKPGDHHHHHSHPHHHNHHPRPSSPHRDNRHSHHHNRRDRGGGSEMDSNRITEAIDSLWRQQQQSSSSSSSSTSTSSSNKQQQQPQPSPLPSSSSSDVITKCDNEAGGTVRHSHPHHQVAMEVDEEADAETEEEEMMAVVVTEATETEVTAAQKEKHPVVLPRFNCCEDSAEENADATLSGTSGLLRNVTISGTRCPARARATDAPSDGKPGLVVESSSSSPLKTKTETDPIAPPAPPPTPTPTTTITATRATKEEIHSGQSGHSCCKRPLSREELSGIPQSKMSKMEVSKTNDRNIPKRLPMESLSDDDDGADDSCCDDADNNNNNDDGTSAADDDAGRGGNKGGSGAVGKVGGDPSNCLGRNKNRNQKQQQQQQKQVEGEEEQIQQQEQQPQTPTTQRYVFRIDSPTYQTDIKWSADRFTDGRTCKHDFGNDSSCRPSSLSPLSNSSYHSPDWSPDYNSHLWDDFSSEDSDEEGSHHSGKSEDISPVNLEPVSMDSSRMDSTTSSGDCTTVKKQEAPQPSNLTAAIAVTDTTTDGSGSCKKPRKDQEKKESSPSLADFSPSSPGDAEFARNLYKTRKKMMLSKGHLPVVTTENNILVLLSRVSQKENPSKFLATVESFWCLLHYISKVPFAYPRSIRILSRVVRNPFCFESLITFMAPAMIFLELMTSREKTKDNNNNPNHCSGSGSNSGGSNNDNNNSNNNLFWTPSTGTMLNFTSAFAVDSYIENLDDLFKAGQLILNDFSQVAEIHFGNSLLAQHLTKKTPQQDSVVACLPFLCRCRNVQEKLLVKFRGFDLMLNIVKSEPESYLSKVVILGLNYLSRHLDVIPDLQNIDCRAIYPKQTLPGSAGDEEECVRCRVSDRDVDKTTVFVTDSGEKIRVDQEEVTSRSEVFSAMLCSDFVEAETHQVKIRYTTYRALEYVVHFLHGCTHRCVTIAKLQRPRNKLNRTDVLDIMDLTDRYMLDNLRKYLACVIYQRYLDENTIATYYDAAVLHNYDDLSTDCIKYCMGQVCLGKRSIECFLRLLKGRNHELFLTSLRDLFIKHISRR
ncbi:uncharacterized protein LOC115224252 [Argonauta hians]